MSAVFVSVTPAVNSGAKTVVRYIIFRKETFFMSHTTTRRIFLGAATAAAAARVWGANDRINVAIVGIGGRGTNHLNIYSRLAEAKVTGLVDVNQAAREKSAGYAAQEYGRKGQRV